MCLMKSDRPSIHTDEIIEQVNGKLRLMIIALLDEFPHAGRTYLNLNDRHKKAGISKIMCKLGTKDAY